MAGVHLLEIDLLRRGKRHVPNLGLPEHDYLCSLWRAGADRLEVWTMRMQDTLPVLPAPLLSPDPDVPLPLKAALDMIYRRGLYQLSIDYRKTPPPPELSASNWSWLREVVGKPR